MSFAYDSDSTSPVTEKISRSWLFCLVGFIAGALILGWDRNILGGQWLLHSDDGLWISIMRRWCAGAKLYTDVWESKGPLFFLWLRPVCLVQQPAPYIIHWEMVLFWAPLLILDGISTCLLAGFFKLGRVGAGLLGLLSVLALWNGNMYQFFATEHLAAGFGLLALMCVLRNRRSGSRLMALGAFLAVTAALLVNWRSGAYMACLPFLKNLNARSLLKYAAVCLIFMASVLLITLGVDRDSYRWFFETLTYGHYYVPIAPWALLKKVGDELVVGRTGLIPVLFPYFDLNFWDRIPWLLDILLLSVLFVFTRLFHAVGGLLRYSWVTSIVVLTFIYATGIPWDHTYALLLPFLVLWAACSLSLQRPAILIFVGLWCGAHLFEEVLPTKINVYAQEASSEALDYGRHDTESYSKMLAGRKWLSLLGNEIPPLVSPGVDLSVNRFFHNYCFVFPPWAEAQAMESLEHIPGLRVALHTRLSEKGCATSRIIAFARQRCQSIGQPRPGLEFLECKR